MTCANKKNEQIVRSFLVEKYDYFCSMNNKEAIRRQKLYYDGLERAVAQPIPLASKKELDKLISVLEADGDERAVLCLWKEVLAPLDVAIAFIHDNRVLPQEKEAILNSDFQPPFMLPDEIFGTLRTLISPTVGELLSVVPVSSGERKMLLDMVENDDREGFVALLEKTHCDTTPLARLCSCCMDDVMAGLTMTDEERAFSLDHLVGTLYDDADNERCREAVAKLQPFIEDGEGDNPESTKQFYADFFDYLVSQLTADLHYYWDYYDLFTLKERNLIESIFEKPIAVNLVNMIWEEYKSETDSAPFSLPDDYFDWRHKSNTPREHFYMDDALKKKGVETFVAFVNWLAEKGYIADDNEVKALFAYRLTGRCRPEGEELPTIEWHGKNNKPYELIYIVRNFSDRGDYRKMRRFFEGPEWVKDRDSSYANSADSEFKRQVAEFYPEACDFRKHYIAKGI